MKTKIIIATILIFVFLMGYVAVSVCSASCCDAGEKCCCKEKKGKILDSWGCVCKGGVKIDGWCTYIEEPEV